MFRFSKKTDYAPLALKYLASDRGSRDVSAHAMAERFAIPLHLLAKILQQLARHALITAHKGTHGGYRRARPAHAIPIADVVHAINGPMTFTACSPIDERCDQFAACTVRDPLWRVRERILAVLRTVTVADMIDRQDLHPGPLTMRKGGPDESVPVQSR